jgi:hypothetical protein
LQDTRSYKHFLARITHSTGLKQTVIQFLSNDIVCSIASLHESLWEDNYLISEASDRFGKETIMKILEERSQTNSNIKAYLDAVNSYQKEKENHKNSQKNYNKNFTLESMLDCIEKPQAFF